LGVLLPFLSLIFIGILLSGFSNIFELGLFVTSGIASAFFALMFASLSRQWMPYVRVAEKVFKALEWPDASNIDLVKSSKVQRTKKDPGEFGTFYFRY
jgi:predicted RND superfamily exporter protein